MSASKKDLERVITNVSKVEGSIWIQYLLLHVAEHNVLDCSLSVVIELV
jgi:hypothetical protein